MTRKKGVAWLDRSLLTSPICYALCLSEKAFHAELKRLKLPERVWPNFLTSHHASATVHFLTSEKNPSVCALVCIGSSTGKTREEVYALLVHEAVHIWQECKELIGETRPGVEQEAYAIQRISLELMHSYKEQTARKKK